MSQVKKNYIYNVVYQLLILIIPIITIPYVSKIVGVNGIGIYSYTYSIAYYFMLFALLGINNYGNRTIAQTRDNKDVMSQKFWEIYIIQILSSIIMVTLYYIYIIVFKNDYKDFAILQSFYVISVIFDVTWFFNGIEKFKIIVLRNTIVKLIGTVLIFLFVKSSSDLNIYISILSLTTLFSQIIVIPSILKYVNKPDIHIEKFKLHLKPIVILFIPVIAVSLYKIMDKIMLGNMTNMAEVGYYENAEKIINIPIIIITCLGTVMMPNASNLIANSKEQAVKKLISDSVNYQMFLSLPMMVGLMLISNRFISLYLGPAFAKSAALIIILSITIPLLSWQTVYKMQYIIPKERDKDYIIATLIGAVTNFCLNLALIPRYKSIGASIATVFAEFFAMLWIVISVRNDIDVNKDLKKIICILIKTIFMAVIVYLIGWLNIKNDLIMIILQTTVGTIIYGLLNYKYILKNIGGKV